MKKLQPFLFCILSICSIHFMEAQTTNLDTEKNTQKIALGFEKASEIVQFKESDTLTIPFSITIDGSYVPSKSDNIKVKISSSSNALNAFLSNNEFNIHASKTKGELKFTNESNKHINSFKDIVESIQHKEAIFSLSFTLLKKKFNVPGTEVSIETKISRKYIELRPDKDESDRKYNFFLGANFDLENKVKANSFYSEIDAYLPGLFFKNKKGDLWGGLRAGIYKNRSLSTNKDRSIETSRIEILENLPENDSAVVENKRILRTPKVSYDNLGFYAELLLRVHNSKNFKMYLAPRAEVIQRVETTSYDFEDLIALGTEKIPKDSLNSRTIRSILSLNRERTAKYYNSYFGLGTPMFYNNKEIEIFLNPVLGMGYSDLARSRTPSREKSTTFFGVFQFHIIEKKHGFKLNGEIRKFFGAGQDPFIVINLSKRIDLKSLIDSNK